MHEIKLKKSGEKYLRDYCNKRKDIYKIIETSEGFRVRDSKINWFGKLLRLGKFFEVIKMDNEFYLYFDSNLIYELYFDELFSLMKLIDLIRDKKYEIENLRLYE